MSWQELSAFLLDRGGHGGNGRTITRTIVTHDADTGFVNGIVKLKIRPCGNESIDDGPPPVNPETGLPETVLQMPLPSSTKKHK